MSKFSLYFGPRNKYNYVNFLKKLSPEEKEKVQIFEFQQKKIGNHKKVIVVDDKVLAGSSNLGYKSLVTSSDHEINFIAESKNFADETLKIIEEDIKYSKVFKNNSKLSLKEIFSAYFHRLNAFLIG